MFACVQVIAGKDKGTVAEVEKVIPNRGMIVVKGVNVKVSRVQSSRRGQGLVFEPATAATSCRHRGASQPETRTGPSSLYWTAAAAGPRTVGTNVGRS